MTFDRFRAAVLDDPSLEQRLREADDWEAFAAASLAAAAERGIELTLAELEDARRRADLAWRIGELWTAPSI